MIGSMGEWVYARLDRRLLEHFGERPMLLEVFGPSLLAAWICAVAFALAWLAIGDGLVCGLPTGVCGAGAVVLAVLWRRGWLRT